MGDFSQASSSKSQNRNIIEPYYCPDIRQTNFSQGAGEQQPRPFVESQWDDQAPFSASLVEEVEGIYRKQEADDPDFPDPLDGRSTRKRNPRDATTETTPGSAKRQKGKGAMFKLPITPISTRRASRSFSGVPQQRQKHQHRPISPPASSEAAASAQRATFYGSTTPKSNSPSPTIKPEPFTDPEEMEKDESSTDSSNSRSSTIVVGDVNHGDDGDEDEYDEDNYQNNDDNEEEEEEDEEEDDDDDDDLDIDDGNERHHPQNHRRRQHHQQHQQSPKPTPLRRSRPSDIPSEFINSPAANQTPSDSRRRRRHQSTNLRSPKNEEGEGETPSLETLLARALLRADTSICRERIMPAWMAVREAKDAYEARTEELWNLLEAVIEATR